jgi:Uma2 family endonuclease
VESEPEPDVAVVPDGMYAEAHPDRAFLIIEVAESSLDYDRETKGPLYAGSGVAEYWIVDVAARSIEVYSHPANGRYRDLHTVDNDGTVAIAAFPDVTIKVSTLFP